MLRADGLRAHLTPQVDLDGGVDGYHVVVAADDVRVVHIVHGEYFDAGIIVYKVVNALRAEREGRDALAPVYLLSAVVDRAALDKLDHGVGEHLGVDAEVVLLLERHAGGVRYGADAELYACTVAYFLGNKAADGETHLVKLHRREDGQLVAVLHDGVDAADMYLLAADRSGLELVDLDKNALCFVEHGRLIR